MVPHVSLPMQDSAIQATASARTLLAPDRDRERGILSFLLVQHRADGAVWRSCTSVEKPPLAG
jgi:hypothetical protein